MDGLNSVRLYCRTDDIRWKMVFCLAGVFFNIAMIGVYVFKEIFMNAYIPHKTFFSTSEPFLFFWY